MTIQNTTINIDGMTCGGCVTSVTNALKQVSGVSSVNVSLEDKNAVVDYDDSQADLSALKSAIEEAGFDVVN